MTRDQEYRWYIVGCDRLGRSPLPQAEFEALWQQYEDHAERLKEAEAAGSLNSLDSGERLKMQRTIQEDPMLKAVLIGQSEDTG